LTYFWGQFSNRKDRLVNRRSVSYISNHIKMVGVSNPRIAADELGSLDSDWIEMDWFLEFH